MFTEHNYFIQSTTYYKQKSDEITQPACKFLQMKMRVGRKLTQVASRCRCTTLQSVTDGGRRKFMRATICFGIALILDTLVNTAVLTSDRITRFLDFSHRPVS